MSTSSKSKWGHRWIAIGDLTLWDENSRIPDYLREGDENALIQILSKKYDITGLADEIVKDRDLPQLERLVVWENGGKLVVLEGNRRVSAYKCLANPLLLGDESQRSKFSRLAKKAKINPKLRVECLVTPDKDQGMRYIERKHYYGNNERLWGQYERDHHIQRTRENHANGLSVREKESLFRANFADQVKRVALPDLVKQQVLSKGFATNFFRVVGGSEGKKKLKYERQDYELRIEDEAEFLALLKIIIFNIVNKSTLNGKKVLNSRSLNQAAAIGEYLSSIQPSDVEIVDKQMAEAKGKTKRRDGKTRTRTSTRRPKATGGRNNSLISPDTELAEKTSPKIKAVYHELQLIDVATCPTAASILVRILIDVSVEEFLAKKGATAVEHLELVKRISKIKDQYIVDSHLKRTVEILISEDLLTRKLNQVAHNTIFQATGTSIRDLWTNLSAFFYFLIPKMKTAA